MKQNYNGQGPSLLGRLCLLLVMFMAGLGSVASAADYEEMDLDHEYTQPKFKKTTMIFTAPQDGLITITAKELDGSPSQDAVRMYKNYDGKFFSDEVTAVTGFGTGVATATLVKGTTYYIAVPFRTDAYKWTATMDSEAKLELVDNS